MKIIESKAGMISRHQNDRELLNEVRTESVVLNRRLALDHANNDGASGIGVDAVGYTGNSMASTSRVQTIDFKFFISELATKYNNNNVAKAFHIPKARVSEWRAQNELLHQAYFEKYGMSTPCSPTTEGDHDRNMLTTKFETVTSSGAGRKKNSYNTEFKLRAVAFAEVSTNRAAAKEFKVHDKRIREWRKNKELLLTTPRDRKRLRGAGRKPVLDNRLEELLFSWLDQVKKENKLITVNEFQQKAAEIASEVLPEGSNFTASKDWVEQFLKMHNLMCTEESTCFTTCSNTEEQSTIIPPTMVDEGDLQGPMEMTVIQQVPVINESDSTE